MLDAVGLAVIETVVLVLVDAQDTVAHAFDLNGRPYFGDIWARLDSFRTGALERLQDEPCDLIEMSLASLIRFR